MKLHASAGPAVYGPLAAKGVSGASIRRSLAVLTRGGSSKKAPVSERHVETVCTGLSHSAWWCLRSYARLP